LAERILKESFGNSTVSADSTCLVAASTVRAAGTLLPALVLSSDMMIEKKIDPKSLPE